MNTTTSGTSGITSCHYCGCLHSGMCPRVQEIEYHKNGTIKRIRLFEHKPWNPPFIEAPSTDTITWDPSNPGNQWSCT